MNFEMSLPVLLNSQATMKCEVWSMNQRCEVTTSLSQYFFVIFLCRIIFTFLVYLLKQNPYS